MNTFITNLASIYTPENIRTLIFIFGGLSLVLFFFASFFQTINGGRIKENLEKSRDAISKHIQKNRMESSKMYNTQLFLTKNGASFHFKWMTPEVFVYMGYGLAFAGFFVGISHSTIAGLVGAVLGYNSLTILVKIFNKMDNKKMSIDIQNIFLLLSNQSKLGIPISSAITECYIVAKNKRLRSALVELSGRILSRENYHSAVENFASKFNNFDLQTLCQTLIQFEQTGAAAKSLSSLSKHSREMQTAMFTKEKADAERNISIVGLLILGCIVGIIIVNMMSTLTSTVF